MRHLLAATCLAAAIILAGGCSRSDVRFIPEGGTYSLKESETRGQELAAATKRDIPTSETEEARKDALLELRGQGPTGKQAAEVLTKKFPPDSGVPLHVEAATIDGVDAWLVVEAAPGKGERLSQRRMWILERDSGEVISSVVLK